MLIQLTICVFREKVVEVIILLPLEMGKDLPKSLMHILLVGWLADSHPRLAMGINIVKCSNGKATL